MYERTSVGGVGQRQRGIKTRGTDPLLDDSVGVKGESRVDNIARNNAGRAYATKGEQWREEKDADQKLRRRKKNTISLSFIFFIKSIIKNIHGIWVGIL